MEYNILSGRYETLRKIISKHFRDLICEELVELYDMTKKFPTEQKKICGAGMESSLLQRALVHMWRIEACRFFFVAKTLH